MGMMKVMHLEIVFLVYLSNSIMSMKVCGNECQLKRSPGFHPENKENIWDKREERIIHQEILMHSEEYPS